MATPFYQSPFAIPGLAESLADNQPTQMFAPQVPLVGVPPSMAPQSAASNWLQILREASANESGGSDSSDVEQPNSTPTQPSEPTPAAGARDFVLNSIKKGESGGRYNVIYGGQQFDDMSQHPGVSMEIPNSNGQHSTAAGAYQFIKSTWNDEAERLGLKDFSPASQDAAAWDYAQRSYKSETGRGLTDDYSNGKLDLSALGHQWTSLAKNLPDAAPLAPTAQGAGAQSSGTSTLASPQAQSTSAPATSSGGLSAGLKKVLLLQTMLPHLQFTPIEYDPFSLQPRISG